MPALFQQTIAIKKSWFSSDCTEIRFYSFNVVLWYFYAYIKTLYILLLLDICNSSEQQSINMDYLFILYTVLNTVQFE
jgi:hypothetical protein